MTGAFVHASACLAASRETCERSTIIPGALVSLGQRGSKPPANRFSAKASLTEPIHFTDRTLAKLRKSAMQWSYP